jgi:hypothetical protein
MRLGVLLWQSTLIFSWLLNSAVKLEPYSSWGFEKGNQFFFGPSIMRRRRRSIREICLVLGRLNARAVSAERKVQGIHRAPVVPSMLMLVCFHPIR